MIATAEKKNTKKTAFSKPLMEDMFKAGVQFGYSRAKRHPKMQPYVSGGRNSVEFINLEKTIGKMEDAKEFLKNLGRENKKILFVGTKPEAKDFIMETANKIKMPFVSRRWMGGTLTNFKMIRERINRLKDLLTKKEAGELTKFTKWERQVIDEEINELRNNFGGLADMEGLPSALIAVDSEKEKNATREARKKGVPIVAIMNTDCDPSDADYPVPANDKSRASIEFILNELSVAYEEGRKLYEPKEEKKSAEE